MTSQHADGKIDIHGSKQKYAGVLAKLEADPLICGENKALILGFLTACSLGKTLPGRAKKRIAERRLAKYLYHLRQLNFWLGNKSFKDISQAEMESFIIRLEQNALPHLKRDGQLVAYSAHAQRDLKICLRKFYKWLLGDGQQYPALVSWIDTSIQEKPPDSLSLEDIRRCVDYATTAKGKALVWTLFETGARAEEFLNIRRKHVEDKGSRLLVRIEYPKTYRRTLPVCEGAAHLRHWLALEGSAGADAPVFPLSYPGLSLFLRRLGKRALGRHVHPHLLRDSFATWLASKRVGRYQMCKLMGWAMSSRMPDRYITRAGVVEEDAIDAIRQDELTRTERENVELKASLARVNHQFEEMQSRLQQRKDADEFLSVLLQDKRLVKSLARAVRQKSLGNKLLHL